MNEGVKILIERMKTNPEEFLQGSKWAGLIHGYKSYLSEEDAKILQDTYNGLMQEEFTAKVMKELLAPEEDDSLGKPFYTKQTSMPLGGATTGGYLGAGAKVSIRAGMTAMPSLTIGDTTLDENTVRQLLATHRATLEELEKKSHQTLFGKLFNYS